MSVYVPSNYEPFRVTSALTACKATRRAMTALGACLGVAALVAGARFGSADHGLAQMPSYAAKPAHPILVSRDVTVQQQYGFITVTGDVQNETRHTVSDVEAMVELFDARGRLLGMESAMLSLPALPAGEDAAYRVQLRDPGAAAAYRIRFKKLDGGMYSSR